MAKLQQELRQKKPFESTKQEAYISLQRTADLVSRPVERIFARWNLTPEQYNVLRILRGSEPEGLPTLEIGYRMITRASNVTRIIDRLEAKGLAIRKRDTGDRRVVNIRISAQGQKLLKEMQPHVQGGVNQSMSGLTDQEAQRFCMLLEKIRGGLEPPPRE